MAESYKILLGGGLLNLLLVGIFDGAFLVLFKAHATGGGAKTSGSGQAMDWVSAHPNVSISGALRIIIISDFEDQQQQS